MKTFVKFSISPAFSFVWGTIHEYVFVDGKKRSELKWDVKPLCMPGMQISFIYKNLEVKGDIFFAINESAGSVKDYDWNESGVLSNFSCHTSRQSGSFFSKMSLSYLLEINKKLSLVPSIGSKRKKIQLTAEDGYIEYPLGSTPVETFGKGIIYEQKYLIPYIGSSIRFIEDIFCFSMGFYYSSLLSCNARDCHIKRDIEFYDNIKKGKYYHVFSNFEWLIVENISLAFDASYTYIPLKKGDSYYIDVKNGYKSQSFEKGSGISANYAELILLFKFYW